ncbi:hypothetical protein SAMN02910298_01409 [Pseudobutyrivibrio sp. YE44]|uniref:hypothetical protein n=1 Tax=Pseudobutyrivibrio sp. YE44 TaxID=1520802 RepID=UPI00088A7BCC|nr:hypothetical protein [Pseudobutyrivibrio sp. YE44]SDB28983.1 hypothetical protein SAMN02910298_01409 [Pseudobutyrivibrio sp. YE44]
MSDYLYLERPSRRKMLFIVEGVKERDDFIHLIFKAYPEINVAENEIVVFGSNIYNLYNKIVQEYDECWDEEDVDLAFIVSKMEGSIEASRKDDYREIFMIFDYERQDTFFTGEKIQRMLKYFSDSTDQGKLYINYPMIEAIQDFDGWPSSAYKDKTVSVSDLSGKSFKGKVDKTYVSSVIKYPQKIAKKVSDERIRERILELDFCSDKANVMDLISNLKTKDKEGCYHYINNLICAIKANEMCGKDYWATTRSLINAITRESIRKANYITRNIYEIENQKLQDIYSEISDIEILELQNRVSECQEDGFVWVLATMVFYLADYNFKIIVN